VRDAHIHPITQVTHRLGEFDTLVMFGNNFGLFGSLLDLRNDVEFSRIRQPAPSAKEKFFPIGLRTSPPLWSR